MTLTWRPGRNTVTATGIKGEYTITYRGAHILSGTGHDGLTMILLVPPRRFHSLTEAKSHAEKLERVKTREWEISGT